MALPFPIRVRDDAFTVQITGKKVYPYKYPLPKQVLEHVTRSPAYSGFGFCLMAYQPS